MKFSRLLAAALLSITSSYAALAQSYPSRPIKLMVAFPPGGSSDYVARTMQPRLEAFFGQPVVIENKPGGAGAIALEALASAPADGHTVLLGGAAPFTSPASMLGAVSFDPQKDFIPVTIVAEVPFILGAAPDLPEKTLAEVTARAKANPKGLTIGHGGNNTAMQYTAMLYNHMAGTKVELVPYRGTGPVMNDLLGSHIPLGILDPPTSMAQIQAGKIRPLAISTKKRFPLLPEIPTFDEAGLKGFEFTGWFGIQVRTGTPPEVVDKISKAFTTVLNEPDVAEKIRASGAEPHPMTVAEQAEAIKKETVMRAELLKTMGAQPQ
jgi:tripartite-type tricarboxylate transporter receptor subunit TctC